MQICRLRSSLSNYATRATTFVTLTLVFGILRPATAAPEARDDSLLPGAEAVEVRFDETPVQHGLVFDGNHLQLEAVTINGSQTRAWAACEGSHPTKSSARLIHFKVTDPRFQNGGRSAVDLEVTYFTAAANGAFTITADTAQGPRIVFKAAGPTKDWKTVHVSLDDAFFGARVDPRDRKAPTMGYDLAIADADSDLYLKSVRLIGFDPDRNVAWSRMLRVESITGQTPGGLCVFPQDSKAAFDVTLRDLARVAVPLRYTLQVRGFDDVVRANLAGKLSAGSAAVTSFPAAFETKAWPLGPYEATLSLFVDDGSGSEPFLKRVVRLGVIDRANLDKARRGEFLYGLDPANNGNFETHSVDAFAYYRLMGVDIVRNLWRKGMPQTVDNVGQALAELGAENVQAALIQTAARAKDPATLEKLMAEKNTFLEEVARRFGGRGPGKLRFYEMGNEPDLTGFYGGPISDYVHAYEGMYDAVKRGAKAAGLADDDTVVMNGGLAFVHAEGEHRSREFLRLVNPAKLDAIAYHGHGPGIASERSAYERVHDAAATNGKERRPFIETESGFMAADRRGLEIQARTVVEKIVYAQSLGAPTFMFFRLYMEGSGDYGYGMTDHLVEPHPSVLSYRNLVERLRHERFVRTLDFSGQGGAKDVDGYLFEEIDPEGRTTGRKTAVVFGESFSQHPVLLRMDAGAQEIREKTVFDLYGNPGTVTSLGGNVAALTAGPDPIFLTWTSPGGSAAVEVAKPLLLIDTSEPLLAGASNTLNISLNAPGTQPLAAELSVEAYARMVVQADPVRQTVSLQPNKPTNVPVTVRLGNKDQPLALPRWWKVFVDVSSGQMTAEQFAELPAQLPGTGGTVVGRYAWTTNNRLDIAKLADGYGEKRAAVAYAFLDSPRVVDLPCSAQGNWWMAWYVNGQKVYDTLADGNGAGRSVPHRFSLPLKAGRNVIALEVLSGRGGWSVDFGGPKERATDETAGIDPDRLEIVLSTHDGTLTRQAVPLQIQEPVPALGEMMAPERLDSWMPLEPLAALGPEVVKNRWFKDPDRSRWYGGAADLSVLAWVRDDGRNLLVSVAVTDDKLVQAPTPDQLAQYDSLRVVLATDSGQPIIDTMMGLVNGRAAAGGMPNGCAFTVQRVEVPANAATWYRLVIPKSLVADKPFRLSFSVSDNDADYLKQTLEMGEVDNPSKGWRMIAP